MYTVGALELCQSTCIHVCFTPVALYIIVVLCCARKSLLLLLLLSSMCVCVCVCVCVQTTVAMPTSEFIPANCRPLITSDSLRGMRSTYPAAFSDVVPSQLAPRGLFSVFLYMLLHLCK